MFVLSWPDIWGIFAVIKSRPYNCRSCSLSACVEVTSFYLVLLCISPGFTSSSYPLASWTLPIKANAGNQSARRLAVEGFSPGVMCDIDTNNISIFSGILLIMIIREYSAECVIVLYLKDCCGQLTRKDFDFLYILWWSVHTDRN